MLRIRDATADDLDALAHVYRAAEGAVRAALGAGAVAPLPAITGWLHDRLAAHDGHPVARWLVADDDGPVGYAELIPPDELAALYVEPARWGTGVARALHDAALAHLRACGVAEARLWVLEGNARARRFYERGGWRLGDGSRRLGFAEAELDLVPYHRAL